MINFSSCDIHNPNFKEYLQLSTEKSILKDLKSAYKLIIKIDNLTVEQSELFSYFLYYVEHESYPSQCQIWYKGLNRKLIIEDPNVYVKESYDLIKKLQNLRNICLSIDTKISINIHCMPTEYDDIGPRQGWIYMIDRDCIYKLDLEKYLDVLIPPTNNK